MKIFIILEVMIVSAFISSWVFSDDFQSYHILKDSGSGLSSYDVKYEEKIITKVKNVQQLIEGQPDIYFEEPIYNFGKVYKNEDVEHFFIFENHGKKDLIIEDIEASCGCIVSEATTSKVLPGMSEGIIVVLRGVSDTGAISKNIKIYSNDPDTPVYPLKLSGEIVEDITVNTRQISFGCIPKGKKVKVGIDVKPRPGFKLVIKDVISTNPDISTEYKKRGHEDKFVVEATLKDTATVGVLTGNIQILTNSERQNRLIIPFSGEVIGDIRLYPSHLYFGTIKKDNKCVKSVFITLLKEKIRVDKIEVQPDYLTSEIITDPRMIIGEEKYVTLHSNFWEASTNFSQKNILEKNSIPLRILTRINGNAPVGEIEGVLKVYTNSKIQPIINIPVSAEIID
ncbi:MAG: DUF1573 domain-containing protein [Candidatus Scalindua sp.]|nr:DUF1573 domain-containing protein [Candidatus Scalindua sp.]